MDYGGQRILEKWQNLVLRASRAEQSTTRRGADKYPRNSLPLSIDCRRHRVLDVEPEIELRRAAVAVLGGQMGERVKVGGGSVYWVEVD